LLKIRYTENRQQASVFQRLANESPILDARSRLFLVACCETTDGSADRS
jgi:hypothetical protein